HPTPTDLLVLDQPTATLPLIRHVSGSIVSDTNFCNGAGGKETFMPGTQDFTAKNVIITGGAGGIGAATSIVLARRGARVLLVDLGDAALAKAAERIARDADAAGRVHTFAADVTNELQVKGYVAYAR